MAVWLIRATGKTFDASAIATHDARMAELAVQNLFTVAEAVRLIDEIQVQPRVVRMPLDGALGLHLAADLIADRDDPPFDKSQMDGFAVRTNDGDRLHVIGEIMAGETGPALACGQAVAIMTGAPLPPGADAVVPIEQTARDGEMVVIHKPPAAGQFIARRGSDCRANAVVLQTGTRLGPAQIAVAASMGAAMVDVFARPRVGVLSTGDELVEIGEQPTGAQIRNSNSQMLVALLGRLGCDAADLGIARDDPATIRAAIEAGLAHDVLFVTGGMSMGERDYVPRILSELGLRSVISKLRIKPGKPFVFATDGQRFAIGLPGNPVSAFVCTLRLASRLLARMSGGAPQEPRSATLRIALPANGPREFYQPAVLARDGGITPLAWKSSADIYTLAAADALLIRPENALPAHAGARVDFIPLP